jgi:putative spermidine/putrescine transport system permease protein
MAVDRQITTTASQREREARYVEDLIERRRFWHRLAPFGLLSPAILLMLVIFLVGMVMLFVNSAYHFNGLKIERIVTFEAWPKFFTDPFYWNVLGRTLWLGAVVTGLAALIGYPTAYAVARIHNPTVKFAFFVLIFSPLLTSVVIRSFGWLILLGDLGFINYLLLAMKIVQEPFKMIYNFLGVTIALTHVLLPFTIFPILSVMTQMDPTLKEAANDLGANRWETFRRVTWPLTLPGLISGAQITFVLASGAYATPSILGGGRVVVLPEQIYQSIVVLNWPIAAVQGMVLLAISLSIVFIFNKLIGLFYKVPRMGEL